MTRAGIWRALTPTEKVYADKEIHVGYTVRTAGRLDPDALRAAYAAVCRAHPQLSARIDTRDGELLVVESDDSPEVQFHEGNPDEPMTGVRLDQHRGLSAVNVVRDGDRASVTLVTHHSVADADHSLHVLAALWSCYTDAVHGVPVDLPRHPYPRPLEDLLAERGIHSPAPAPAAVPAQRKPDLVVLVRHMAQLRLTAAETTALVEFSRRNDVTLNGLLSGAILLVEAELRDLPLTDLALRFTVNLRNRLTPPVGATEGANVVGGGRFTVPPGIEPEVVAIGRVVGEQLRAGLADGSMQRSLLDMVDLVNRLSSGPWQHQPPPGPAPAVISLTNWGPIPPLRSPDGLELTNFHSCSHIREAPAAFEAARGYVASTFGGRLGIDLAFPEKDPAQAERLERIRELLARFAGQT